MFPTRSQMSAKGRPAVHPDLRLGGLWRTAPADRPPRRTRQLHRIV